MAPLKRFRIRLRPEQARYALLTGLAILVGILGAFGNLLFRVAIDLCSYGFRTVEWNILGIDRGWPWTLLTPLVLVSGGVVLIGLERLFPGDVLGYGFPRFLEMLHLKGGG